VSLLGIVLLVGAVQAAARFKTGMCGCEHVFELHYNAALLAHKRGDLQDAFSQVRSGALKALLAQQTKRHLGKGST